MDAVRVAFQVASLLRLLDLGASACPIGCSCAEGNVGRSLLCMETSMRQIPRDIPRDFSKIRIENCHLAELPRGSFSHVGALEFLWLNFNEIALMDVRSLEGLANLTELRMQGNRLTSVPWTAFRDTPKLRILDLKHNRLDALPEHALRHLPALTYMDLSFNRLGIVSRDVFVNWPLYRAAGSAWGKEGLVANVVLALHGNPWLCDCRLKGFVEFIRAAGPPVVLMNSYLKCSGPASKAGKFFHEVQLKTCARPSASATAAETNVTLPLGANATLTCSAEARPAPTIQWLYSLKATRGVVATETQVNEETVVSRLVIPSLRPADRGIYTCTANNFIGNSSVTFAVDVAPLDASAPPPSPPPVPAPPPDDNDDARVDIRVARQTVYGVTLEWRAATGRPADAWFTVHFGKFDSPKRETVHVGPGISSYSVGDLLPVTKYEACVTLRNRPPRDGQCVVFVTGSDVGELERRERLIHIVVVVCAMVLAVPAGMYACTAEARFGCPDRCLALWRRRERRGENPPRTERQGTFDSLQAPSDEGLCRDSEERPPKRPRSEDRCKGGSAAHLY